MDEKSRTAIAYIFTAFEKYALGDIIKTKDSKMPIAAFILSVCFIDQLSGFIYDNNEKGCKTSTERSKKFVEEYLNNTKSNKYDKDDLIDLLRNKLVHNYSLSDRKRPKHNKYLLDYENPSLHLHRQGDMVFINIDGFVEDISAALRLYKLNLILSEKLEKNAIQHYNMFGILTHKEINVELLK